MRLRIPYMVALVLGGLALGSISSPILDRFYSGQRPDWLTPEVILFFFLPALLFEGSVKINFKQLRQNLVPILLLANAGTLAAALVTSYALHWIMGLPILTALLFGSAISATDPISVLSIFKDLRVTKRLTLLVEAESLLNDGTAAVLFQIFAAAILTREVHLANGVAQFFLAIIGGGAVGFGLSYILTAITSRIDDPQIEITLTTILAYGSYLIASHLHLSGVIATVVAGITVGNITAKTGMSARTRLALWSFWEYAAFIINSLVFLLIGIEVRVGELIRSWPEILLAVAAVLLGRMLVRVRPCSYRQSFCGKDLAALAARACLGRFARIAFSCAGFEPGPRVSRSRSNPGAHLRRGGILDHCPRAYNQASGPTSANRFPAR